MKAPIKILLIVLLVAITQPTNAHWNDWWSDGSHMLDEVTCTAEDLSNKDDDWYRRNDDITNDYSDNSSSYTDNYGSYRNNSNSSSSTIRIAGSNTNNDNGDAYTLKTTDNLVKPLADMPKPGYKQGLVASCVFAGLAFSYQLLKGKEINEGVFLLKYLQLTKNGQVDIQFETRKGFDANPIIISQIAENSGYFSVQQNVTNIEASINEGMIVLSAIDMDDYYHDIVIVGYTDDGNCEYYIYYDTSDGKYKLIDRSDVTLYYIGLK